MKKTLCLILSVLLLSLCAAAETPTSEQEKAQQEMEISKSAQNPLSGLILMPVQFNYDPNIGPLNKSASELLIEPTFPIKINDDWKILTHTIIPIVSVPQLATNNRNTGLSNIMISALLSPVHDAAAKYSWGIGGGIMLPTASNDSPVTYTNTPTGFDSWAAGPAVVGVYKDGPWVTGALFNQIWSFDAAAKTNLNTMQIQGFAFYNISGGYSVGYMPLININWNATASQSTTLPVGLQFGKLFMIDGFFPLGLSVGGYYNLLRPDDAPTTQWRAQLFFVLPESVF